jgi:hypothetical protein
MRSKISGRLPQIELMQMTFLTLNFLTLKKANENSTLQEA